MDFKDELKNKATDLTTKAQALCDINIKWEQSILINCEDLKDLKTLQESKVLDVFAKNKKLPAIYYFKIASDQKKPDIVNALKFYKDKKERSCPKITNIDKDKQRSFDSEYLYCGSKKKDLNGRLVQHLGFGSNNTYALQLFHWATALKLKLEFHYAWLDEKHKEITELVESTLAEKIKPLVGKIA